MWYVFFCRLASPQTSHNILFCSFCRAWWWWRNIQMTYFISKLQVRLLWMLGFFLSLLKFLKTWRWVSYIKVAVVPFLTHTIILTWFLSNLSNHASNDCSYFKTTTILLVIVTLHYNKIGISNFNYRMKQLPQIIENHTFILT